MCNFKYKLCSERINPFTLNIYLNKRCLPPLTILFQENINTEHIHLGAGLQGDCPPPLLPSLHTMGGKSFSLSKACYTIRNAKTYVCRFQWPYGLRRRSSAARLLRSWVRIPPRAWMFVL